tara:strand:- start:2457 stop:2726 length:270 start_codon:yes stop_codon:yes gene_type:complete
MEEQSQEYDYREFMIFPIVELPNINFSEVLETSEETVRKSIDGAKTFVKWNGAIPNCISRLITKEGPYTYDEILVILSTPEWTSPIEEI